LILGASSTTAGAKDRAVKEAGSIAWVVAPVAACNAHLKLRKHYLAHLNSVCGTS